MTEQGAATSAATPTSEASAGVEAEPRTAAPTENTKARDAVSRWLVALDVDGTILDEDEHITQPVIDQVRRLQTEGHEVTLATGRSWETTRPILERLGLTPEYVVSANGALTLRRDASEADGYRRVHVETFDPSEVLERIRHHLPEGRFMVEDETGYRYYTAGMNDWNLTRAEQVEFSELAGRQTTRVVVVSPDHDIEEFLQIVEQMGLHQVTYSIGWTAWLDISPEGVNKGTALERVRDWLDIPRERVLVAGDGRNDIDMFHWAGASGRAIAMGQAPSEVQDAATEVTASIDDDGLAHALAVL